MTFDQICFNKNFTKNRVKKKLNHCFCFYAGIRYILYPQMKSHKGIVVYFICENIPQNNEKYSQ